MFDGFFKIDRSMGESRLAQFTGGLLLISIIVDGIIYFNTKGGIILKWMSQLT